MDINKFVFKKASEGGICASFLESEAWLPTPLLKGEQVLVYISSFKKTKSTTCHIRWSTDNIVKEETALIEWGNSNTIDCQLPVGQSYSINSKKYVTRYKSDVKLDDIEGLLNSHLVTFVSGSFSEKLVIDENIGSILYFLAYCYGYEQLTLGLREKLDQLYDEECERIEIENQKKKEEEERKKKERENLKYQKNNLIVKLAKEMAIRLVKEKDEYFSKHPGLSSDYVIGNTNDRFETMARELGGLEKIYYNDPISGIRISEYEVCDYLKVKNVFSGYSTWDLNHSAILPSRLSISQALDLIEGRKSIDKVKEEWGRITIDTEQKKTSQGCYIATCAYGSYDCPEVWALRRFRDQSLNRTLFGRLFIKIYYVISPKLVQWFGSTRWFRFLCRKGLDPFVQKLKASGYKSSPYDDTI